MKTTKLRIVILMIGIMSFIAACGQQAEPSGGTSGTQSTSQPEVNEEENEREGWPDKLVVGQVPSEDEESMTENFEPFRLI